MIIKLHGIAGKAYFNMNKATQAEYEEGIKFALTNLPEDYDGTKSDCIDYLTDKINIAIHNSINNHKLYVGTIILYNAMIKELL